MRYFYRARRYDPQMIPMFRRGETIVRTADVAEVGRLSDERQAVLFGMVGGDRSGEAEGTVTRRATS